MHLYSKVPFLQFLNFYTVSIPSSPCRQHQELHSLRHLSAVAVASGERLRQVRGRQRGGGRQRRVAAHHLGNAFSASLDAWPADDGRLRRFCGRDPLRRVQEGVESKAATATDESSTNAGRRLRPEKSSSSSSMRSFERETHREKSRKDETVLLIQSEECFKKGIDTPFLCWFI